MRITFIINSLALGGSERQLFYLVRGLLRKEVSCQVLYIQKPGPYLKDFRKLGIEPHYLGGNRRNGYLRYLAVLSGVLKRVGAFRPDLVQSFSPPSNLIAVLCCLIRGIPAVINERNINVSTGLLARLFRILLYRFSYSLVCNSRTVEQWAARYYFLPRRKTRVIYNGIDTAEFTAGRRERNGPSFNILTVASFKQQKGHSYLVRAVPEVIRRYPSARFIFVGNGGERKKVEELTAELGVQDFVSFAGPQADIGPYYREADLFCLPSLAEGLPNAVMEAMACGIPVVAARAGGTPELVIDQQTGLLVSPGEPGQLATGLDRALRDKPLRERLSRKARDYIRNFSLERYIDNYLGLYREIITDRG